MGVTYKEIAEMIETGKTNKDAQDKIIKMYKASMHKRRKIPVYEFERKNFLVDQYL